MNTQRQNNKRRSRRARRVRRSTGIFMILTIVVLVLGLCGWGIWQLFEETPEIMVQNYPVEYEALIRTYADENKIPPAYVASVILAESSYRADVVSYADAEGLMQILPSTAGWIAGKFDEQYVENSLFDPETNIRYGCWYLGFLMERYDGNMSCASAAYHAGQGTVDKWLQNPEYSSNGKTLDKIASDATDTYVSRILKYYEKYKEIYAQDT